MQDKEAKSFWRTHGVLILVVFASLLVRVVWAISLGDEVIWMDEGDYHNLAWNVVHGKGLSLDGQSLTATRPPGFPLFLSFVYWFSSPRILSARIAQAFLWAVITWLAYLLALELGFSRRSAIITAILVAFYPYYIYMSGALYPVTLLTLFLLASSYGLIKVYHGAGRFAQIGTGLALGTCMAVIPYSGVVFLFLPLWFFTSPQVKTWRERVACLLVMGVAAGLLYSPWVVRNYIQFHTFIPSHAHGATAFWNGNGNTEGSEGVNHSIRLVLPPDVVQQLPYVKTELEADRLLWKAAREHIRSNPQEYLKKSLQRALHFYALVPYTVQRNRHSTSPLSKYIPMLSYGPILFLGLIGLVMRRRQWRYWLLFAFYFLAFTLVAAFIISRVRYRLPMDVYLILLASVPLARLMEYLRLGRTVEKA